MKYDAFISYRREGGSEIARMIQQALSKRRKRVFLDVDELGTGAFDKALLDNISESPTFLLVLSPHALDRCKNPNDWLAVEISHAIAEHKNIVPLLQQGFEWPDSALLPEVLRNLHTYNGIKIHTDEYFEAFIGAIIDKGLAYSGGRVLEYGSLDPVSESRDYLDKGLEATFDRQLDDALLLFKKSVIMDVNQQALLFIAFSQALLRCEPKDVLASVDECRQSFPGYELADRFERDLKFILTAEPETRSSAALKTKIERLAKEYVERSSEAKRFPTLFEVLCPTSMRSAPHVFWAVVVSAYYILRGILSGMFHIGYLPLVLIMQWLASVTAITGAYLYSKFSYQLYYPLKNQLEIGSRERFHDWYNEKLAQILGVSIEERGLLRRGSAWVKQNRLLFGLCMFIVIFAISFCIWMTDFDFLRDPLVALNVIDIAVLWLCATYPFLLIITSVYLMYQYSRLPLKPLATRLNLYSLRKLVQMIEVIGAMTLLTYFCILMMALLSYKEDVILDSLLHVGTCILVACLTLGMPIYMRNSFQRSKIRIIKVYTKYVENAFGEFLQSPTEEHLKQYEWMLRNEHLIKRFRTFLLPPKDLVIIILLNVVNCSIAIFYFVAKANHWRIDIIRIFDSLLWRVSQL